jgi:hypothetical protein
MMDWDRVQSVSDEVDKWPGWKRGLPSWHVIPVRNYWTVIATGAERPTGTFYGMKGTHTSARDRATTYAIHLAKQDRVDVFVHHLDGSSEWIFPKPVQELSRPTPATPASSRSECPSCGERL